MNSGGGYSGGSGEPHIEGAQNGLASHQIGYSTNHICSGGGYFERGTRVYDGVTYTLAWFGQGGPSFSIRSSGGCGGYAGKGGNIKYSSECNINAFNGDMITNGNYDEIYYNRNEDGLIYYKLVNGGKKYYDYTYDEENNQYYRYDEEENKIIESASIIKSDILTVMTKKNNSKFIPTVIYAQEGIQRAVYCSPIYMPDNMKNFFGVTGTWTETTIEKISERNNITSFGQGIGSGAGYFEISNGTYELVSTLN